MMWMQPDPEKLRGSNRIRVCLNGTGTDLTGSGKIRWIYSDVDPTNYTDPAGIRNSVPEYGANASCPGM